MCFMPSPPKNIALSLANFCDYICDVLFLILCAHISAHTPHLRHHLVGHESLDGCQTQLGDFWLFGAAAHQERLHHFGAVLLQSFKEEGKKT